MFILSQDNVVKATADTYNEALYKLHDLQPMSWDWAMRYEGWSIDEQKYIIDASKEFAGTVLNTIINGKVSNYSGEPLTLAEYAEQPQNEGRELKVIDSEELKELIDKHRAGMIQDFQEISEGRYWEMLEVLPPMNYNGTYFQISEALQYDIRSTFTKKNGKFYEATLPTGSADKNKKYIDRI